MKRLYLLDAYALIYRAHFAFIRNPLMNSKGMNVSAVTGFVNTLQDLLYKEKIKPTHMAIAFDPLDEKTFRSDEYPEYKANREKMPEDIRTAIPYIRRLAAGFRIPILELAGYEADDVIGTIAKKAEQDGFEVYMVTPDKDYGQLVSDKVFMYKPPWGKTPKAIMGEAEILKKWDIQRIDQVIDMLGMMGDAVDNIPGIKGVGEKTAVKLLKQFDTMENMLQNTNQIKGKLREKVETGASDAIISKKLATIVLDVPIDYEPDSYVLEEIDKSLLKDLFIELEFRSIAKRILGDDYTPNQAGGSKTSKPKSRQLDLFSSIEETKKETPTSGAVNTINADLMPETEEEKGKNMENVPHEYHLIDTPEKRADLIKQLEAQTLVCFDTETTNIDANKAELVGLAFSFKAHEGFYVPVPEKQDEAQTLVDEFKSFFSNDKIAKIGQNIKYDILMLKWYGIEVKGVLHDTMLAHYLIEPDMRHNLTILAETYLNYTPVEIETLIGKKGKNQLSMRQAPIEKVAKYAAEDADITYQLHHKFTDSVQQEPLHKLYADVETPLVPVLAEMEFNGVALDADFLREYSKELGLDIDQLKTSIFTTAGVEFNLDSPKQLGKVLFDRMQIPYKGKKTKTGQYSTNEQILNKLAPENPIISSILAYRELTKLRNTYVDALPALINPKTKRIHSSFNQAVAATGRLSSANPNLQNIPIRTDRGRQVRKAFIPRSADFVLLAADYSQVELRLMASMSEDKNMIQAFNDGLDIHTATAARVYGVDLDKVDKTMRRNAKMVNFGIIYGISAHGLAQRLGISRTEAKTIIDEYFKQYEGVKTYMEKAVEKAKANGFAETILGRRRYLKDINSRNHTVRSFAERNAINAPIQGSAADMIKVAMIDIYKEMQAQNLQSKMILQVHDELVFDAHKSELEQLTQLVQNKMKDAIKIAVPLVVDVGVGDNWLEAH